MRVGICLFQPTFQACPLQVAWSLFQPASKIILVSHKQNKWNIINRRRVTLQLKANQAFVFGNSRRRSQSISASSWQGIVSSASRSTPASTRVWIRGRCQSLIVCKNITIVEISIDTGTSGWFTAG